MAKKIEAAEQVDYASENQQLVLLLTKRNEQYLHDLDKSLILANVSEADRDRLKHTMMTELIAGQKTGKTARQLFGTVSEQTKLILEGPKQEAGALSPNWQLYLDGALLMGSIFMIFAGLSENYAMGILSLILNYFVGGFMMLMISKSSAKYQREMVETKKKLVPILRYLVIVVTSMMIWLVALTAFMFIPTVINPVLPGTLYVGLGAATLGAKFYFKKKLGIRGGVF